MQTSIYLQDTLLLLGAMTAVLITMLKLHLSPALGYLLIGTVIGHYNLIHNIAYTKEIADLGIVFLLFVIGMELTLEKLVRWRVYVFGFGGLQILLTTAIVTPLVILLFDTSMVVAIVISVTLALSSTAIVMQILNENKATTTRVGALSISAMLMQDCAVVPLLVAIPILAKVTNAEQITSAVWNAELKAVAIVTIIIITGRALLHPFFAMIRSLRRDDPYVNVALLIALCAAWITEVNGLSTAMGAFLAGLLIAETEFRGRIEESILPFQGLFLALFFISTGMGINVDYMIGNFTMILALTVSLMLIKIIVVFILSKCLKFTSGQSANTALLLSQCSEFAFVSLGLANRYYLISNDLTQLLFMVISLTMAVTPLLAALGKKLEYMCEGKRMMDSHHEFEGVSEMYSHVIIAGFGRVGQIVAFMLEQKHVSYVALDENIALVKKARMEGYQVYHGDMTNYEAFKALGADRAALIILGMDDTSAMRKAIKKLRQHCRHKFIIARAEDSINGEELRKLGATISVPTTTEVGLRLGVESLLHLHIPECDIQSIVDKLRKNHYATTRSVELLSSRKKLQGEQSQSNIQPSSDMAN